MSFLCISLEEDKDEDGELKISMPLTDKQLRKEKRKKAAERLARKQVQKKARGEGDVLEGDEVPDESAKFNEFTVVKSPEAGRIDVDESGKEPSGAVKQLIRQGLGRQGPSLLGAEGRDSFEVVPQGRPSDRTFRADLVEEEEEGEGQGGGGLPLSLPVHDDRRYDSDNEQYDTHDRNVTLALGTMVRRLILLEQVTLSHSLSHSVTDYDRFFGNPARRLSWMHPTTGAEEVL